MNTTKYLANWLALWRSPGIGAAAFHQCLQQDPELTTLPDWVMSDHPGIERDLNWATQANHHILTLLDPDYPPILKQIHQPPPLLFVQGNYLLLKQPQIAIVGSRNPSALGLQLSFTFAQQLAAAGLVITSGLALGIDAASHRGALAVAGNQKVSNPDLQSGAANQSGKTIAVLAHGLDLLYPPQHTQLAQQIVARDGALVSEFPLKVPPKAQHFPQRNRIISGLSLGVVVVEAALQSGSLITARHAVEQGREVFAVPGSAANSKARGCHSLIQQGAKLVTSAKEIIEELGSLLNFVVAADTIPVQHTIIATRHLAKQTKSTTKSQQKGRFTGANILPNKPNSPLSALPTESLLAYINHAPTPIDHISANSGYSIDKIGGMLLQLELQGHISAVPGGYIRLI